MGFLIADFGMTKVERRIQRAIFCASGFVIISSFVIRASSFFHSERKAMTGSTRHARRAGTQQARAAAVASNKEAVP